MYATKTPGDVLFLLIGAMLILAMHAGFAFLELGTVRGKNQVNALVYGALKLTIGLRLSQEQEYNGADLSIHRISATSEPENALMRGSGS